MEVYIKNMEIRENCMNCAARHGAECWLAACSYIPNYHKERPKWCPLVPVPPHGDLIERNALIKQARTQFDWNDVVDVEDIANAPTIIPAEIISENEIKIIDTKGKSNYDPKRRFVIMTEEDKT